MSAIQRFNCFWNLSGKFYFSNNQALFYCSCVVFKLWSHECSYRKKQPLHWQSFHARMNINSFMTEALSYWFLYDNGLRMKELSILRKFLRYFVYFSLKLFPQREGGRSFLWLLFSIQRAYGTVKQNLVKFKYTQVILTKKLSHLDLIK